jgi:hypothetical protein
MAVASLSGVIVIDRPVEVVFTRCFTVSCFHELRSFR